MTSKRGKNLTAYIKLFRVLYSHVRDGPLNKKEDSGKSASSVIPFVDDIDQNREKGCKKVILLRNTPRIEHFTALGKGS